MAQKDDNPIKVGWCFFISLAHPPSLTSDVQHFASNIFDKVSQNSFRRQFVITEFFSFPFFSASTNLNALIKQHLSSVNLSQYNSFVLFMI